MQDPEARACLYFQEVSQDYQRLSLPRIQSRVSLNESANFVLEHPKLKAELTSNFKMLRAIRDTVTLLQDDERLVKHEAEKEYLRVFKKTVLIRMDQDQYILGLGARTELPQQTSDSELLKNFGIVIHNEEDINPKMILLTIQHEREYLRELATCLQIVKKNLAINAILEVKTTLLEAKAIHSKVYTIAELIPAVVRFSKEDLINFKGEFSERWEDLKDHITFRSYGTEGTVLKAFENLREGIIYANAAMNKLQDSQDLNLPLSQEIKRYFNKGFNLLQLLFMKEKARKEAEKLISEPDPQLVKRIWNMTDKGITKKMLSIIFPDIVFSQKIYIPKLFSMVTNDNLQRIITNKLKLQYNQGLFAVPHIQQYRNSLYASNKHSRNRIKIRINCSKELAHKVIVEQTFIEKINGVFKLRPKHYKTVVMHIHGGGFVSMSSYSHQMYTRRWANQLNVPIFSVDYAKAPQNPYPQGLNDCLQAYLWLLGMAKQIYEVSPQKIILVGDSAGGNLVAALTCLLITLQLRKPDAIFMIYPALNLDEKAFTPSMLNTLDDFILPHTYLKVCAHAYTSKYKPPSVIDYLLSPIQAPELILSQFPKTRIYVGSKDPFSDDCMRLTEKLKNTGVDSHLTVYQNFSHGFIQFDNILQPIPIARSAVDEICQDISKQVIY